MDIGFCRSNYFQDVTSGVAREKAQCVLWFHESKSPIAVQRQFRQCYGRKLPDVKSIKEWYAKLKETGSICDLPRIGTLTVTESKVDLVRRAYQRLDILRATKGNIPYHIEIPHLELPHRNITPRATT
ncbi:hypothetical protein AVEN_194479-1 [Araneus ventricosus]|uniref:DUF4817 domain-containing protein n=1 Tax=Araneus ventricosus TaxID=182803 RepID=A0A4Y2A647_ARAVE|nr:hypothetical protein AVEN_194479-1 [Araneus ventricosus]